MKAKNFCMSTIIAFALTSCFPTYYYQVYKATPTDKATVNESTVVFEDENCQISYNLWHEGGSMGFRFYNKTDQNIYINKQESFYVFNGSSYNYYKNRVTTNTANIGTSVVPPATIYGNTMTSAVTGAAVQFIEEKVIIIPSRTSKSIQEYSINTSLYRDCYLYRYPNSKKQMITKPFTASSSPMVFSNRLVYTVGLSGNPVNFNNEFFISEITNYSESDVFETVVSEFCGQKKSTTVFKLWGPEKFYIKYTDDALGERH